ncbi:hypothetical protein ABY44_39365 [Burkholderia sp. ZZQ-2]|uniref:hypothetical protein n=1 Tax=Burkholderia sp. ZZQ-2 TaxID=1661766 RepID=UPI003D6FA7E1
MTTRNKNGRTDVLTAQAALAAIETFEIVGENNSSRDPNADDRFILTEYIAHAFDGYPVDQAAASATETGAEGAVYQILTEEGAWLDVPQQIYDRTKSDPALTRIVYRAPARAIQKVDGWQPIATAPKDGSEILLSNGTHVQQGWSVHDEGGTTEHRDMDGRYIGQTDSDGYIGWWDVGGGIQPEPDRWMPMPEESHSPAMAAEAVAIPAGYALVPIDRSYDMRAKALIAFNTTEQAGKDRDDALDAAYRAELAAAPQPAQADAQVGLTNDLRQRCRELLELNEKGESPQVALRVLADTYHPDISAHDRRSMAVSQTHIEALRALLAAHPGQPEPRAEASDDWISVTAQRPCDAGIASCDDVLAWNNDPGFPTIVEAHFVSPGFPEYTHWKRKPIGPANIARTGASA